MLTTSKYLEWTSHLPTGTCAVGFRGSFPRYRVAKPKLPYPCYPSEIVCKWIKAGLRVCDLVIRVKARELVLSSFLTALVATPVGHPSGTIRWAAGLSPP